MGRRNIQLSTADTGGEFLPVNSKEGYLGVRLHLHLHLRPQESWYTYLEMVLLHIAILSHRKDHTKSVSPLPADSHRTRAASHGITASCGWL